MGIGTLCSEWRLWESWPRTSRLSTGWLRACWLWKVSLYQKACMCFGLRPLSRIGSETPGTSSRKVSAMSSLMSNQNLAKRWFQLCTTTHSRCKPKPCGSNFPTRLLYIADSEKHTSVRVIMTDESPRTSQYMTLSHCWGTNRLITLRSDNIEELRKGIQLEKLPKTFQDAVAVAG